MPRTRKKQRTAKWDRCVRKVKRRRTAINAAAVCTAALKRQSNPRQVVLYAQGKKTPVLKYMGGIKFGKRGRPVRFDTRDQALALAKEMKLQFPVLRKFRTWAE